MGGGSSSPEPVTYSKEELEQKIQNGALEAENANLKQRQKQAEKYRDEQRQQQNDWMAANEAQMEKYMQLLSQGGQRDRGLDAQVEKLESAAADAERKLREQEDQCRQVQQLMELKEKDVEAAVLEASILNEKYLQLHKDQEDWKKAEEEKSEQLMKESPPPLSLRKNPPNMTPLYTHEMACFAFMGRAGTGKSTMINTLVETFTGVKQTENKLKTSSLAETTQGCPAPVFTKTSDGRDIALFDRPGVGLKALQLATGESTDATTNFIASQGLKWWTAIILNIDRDATPQEALIYSMCKAIGTPILVTRNKATETFEKEKKDCELCGDIYDETKALQTIEDYIENNLHVDKGSWLLVDTYHPEKFQWKELVAYLEQHSRKESTVGVAEK